MGDYSLDDGELKYKGETIDMGDFSRDLANGDLGKIMTDLGADLGDTEVSKFVSDYESAYNKQPGIEDIKDVGDTEAHGSDVEQKVGDVQNTDDLDEALKKNKELSDDFKKKIDELKKKAEEDAKTGKKSSVGKWVKRLLYAGLAVAGIGEIINLIKQHEAEMNGCWLVEKSSGTKCKVGMLTCNSDARKYGTQCGSISGCGKNKDEACFTNTTCVKYNPPPSKGVPQTCKTTLTQCTDGDCSEYCDVTKISVPEGYFLTCVNVNFWGAASDLFEEPFNFGSNILGSITKILKYALYIGLLLLGLYVLYKLVTFFLGGRKQEITVSR